MKKYQYHDMMGGFYLTASFFVDGWVGSLLLTILAAAHWWVAFKK